jgi:hypothetical protein
MPSRDTLTPRSPWNNAPPLWTCASVAEYKPKAPRKTT